MMTSDWKYLVRIVGAGLAGAVEVDTSPGEEPTSRSVIKAVRKKVNNG
jgi:hypothetical protein